MLQDIKRIVYASDLVDYDARDVLALAVKQAILNKAKLTFMSVIEPMSGSSKLYLSSYLSESQIEEICLDQEGSVRQEIEKRIRSFCEEELENMQGFDAKDIDIEVVYGKPGEKIVEVAKKKEADLIVMGTRVHNSLSEFTHASVAHKVTVHAKCPVLIAHIHKQD